MACPEFDAVIAAEQKILKALRAGVEDAKNEAGNGPLKGSAAAAAVFNFWDHFANSWFERNEEVTKSSTDKDGRLDEEQKRLAAMIKALPGSDNSFWKQTLEDDKKATTALQGTC